MRYKILFALNKKRASGVQTGYRPDWICDNKPEYNCACLFIDKPKIVQPGEQAECEIELFQASLWTNVHVGDVLKCMEGPTQVGEALVLEIIK